MDQAHGRREAAKATLGKGGGVPRSETPQGLVSHVERHSVTELGCFASLYFVRMQLDACIAKASRCTPSCSFALSLLLEPTAIPRHLQCDVCASVLVCVRVSACWELLAYWLQANSSQVRSSPEIVVSSKFVLLRQSFENLRFCSKIYSKRHKMIRDEQNVMF